jgi:hypothetical protein
MEIQKLNNLKLMENKIKSVFETLNAVNCNEHTEKKNGLTYLSWAWAWAEVKKLYPNASYTIYENAQQWNYFTDGKTCWVKTGVTIEGLEHIEYLPVMDFRNKSIAADKVTSFDVNTAIQRSLTKACARHGLGLYIYAGEDLPEDEQTAQVAPQPAPAQPAMTDMDIAKLVAQANSCKTADEVMKIYNDHKELWSNEKFSKPIIAIGKAKREQEKGGAA